MNPVFFLGLISGCLLVMGFKWGEPLIVIAGLFAIAGAAFLGEH